MLASRLGSPRAITVIDQAVSSLTNFVAGLVAARTLSPAEFGVFGVWTFVYVVSLGVTRSALSDVGAVTPVARGGREAQLAALDSVFWLAVVALLATTASATLFGPPALLATAGVLVMLVQDSTRIASIAAERPAMALVNDTLWLCILACFVGAAALADLSLSASLVTAMWGLAALPGILVFSAWNSWRPELSRSRAFVVSRARTSGAFVADWVLKQGTAQLATYGLGLLGGLTAVAGIRAGLLLLGPLNIAFTGLQLAALPAAVRLSERDPARMRRTLRLLSLTLASISIGMGFALAAAPGAWLELVVGEQAAGLSDYVLPLAFALGASGLMTATHMELRVRQAGAELIAARLASTVLYLLCGAAGYWISSGSTEAGLWGLAVGTFAGVVVWETQLRSRFPIGRQPIGA